MQVRKKLRLEDSEIWVVAMRNSTEEVEDEQQHIQDFKNNGELA